MEFAKEVLSLLVRAAAVIRRGARQNSRSDRGGRALVCAHIFKSTPARAEFGGFNVTGGHKAQPKP
jgi:hypothetical protein